MFWFRNKVSTIWDGIAWRINFCFSYFKGQLATEAFEDVGHSDDARDIMKEYHIGELAEVGDLLHHWPHNVTKQFTIFFILISCFVSGW